MTEVQQSDTSCRTDVHVGQTSVNDELHCPVSNRHTPTHIITVILFYCITKKIKICVVFVNSAEKLTWRFGDWLRGLRITEAEISMRQTAIFLIPV